MDAYSIFGLAITTIGTVFALAVWQRGRVAALKGDSARSAFVTGHGEPARANRPGTEH